MYLRYYSLPNREGKGVGTVSKELNELNNIFGRTYKAPSDMKRGLKKKILEDKFDDLTPSNFFDVESGKYRDF